MQKHGRDYIRLYKNEQGDLTREGFCPYPKNNDQVIRETETEHNLHVPNQPDLVVKMYMARIKDAAASSLEPPSLLIIQELQDEGTGYSAASAAPSQYLRVFGEAQGGAESYRYSGGRTNDRWTTAAATPYESMHDSNKV